MIYNKNWYKMIQEYFIIQFLLHAFQNFIEKGRKKIAVMSN